MEIRIRQLGLAAFIKMKSIEKSETSFLGYRDEFYIFESNKSLEEWKIEYLNSESSVFDNCLRELREFEKNRKNIKE